MESDIQELSFYKLNPLAEIPRYATAGASGMDVRSVEQVHIHPGDILTVDTGLSANIPSGYELQVRPRSGLASKNGITVLNAPGTIDADYLGPIKVILINHSRNTFEIKVGDRIAQLVLMKVTQAIIKEKPNTKQTDRGTGGFGSTGTT